jgi:transcriptional regulator with XRE-family HTH domain
MLDTKPHASLNAIPVPYLAAWRRWFGLSQQELAEAAGIHVDVLRLVERGVRPAQGKTIRRLANALGIDRPTLLYRTPEQAPDDAWEAAKARRAIDADKQAV